MFNRLGLYSFLNLLSVVTMLGILATPFAYAGGVSPEVVTVLPAVDLSVLLQLIPATLMGKVLALWTILSSIVATASAIVAFTPSKRDDAWFAKVKPWFDFLALNVFNARR
jgi:hypothetical protein